MRMANTGLCRLLGALWCAGACAATLFAQAPPAPAPEPSATELAKQTQNPVGDIVAIPFQFNFNNGGDLKDRTLFNLNFQPVIPIHISAGWTVIARTIVPINSIPGPDNTRFSGVGDIQEQIFFTPAKASKIIWGIGPAFSFPTSTAAPTDTGTWGAGGSAVVVAMPGPWVLGSLFVQISPMADYNGKPRTNSFLWQYFINYNFGKGWAISSAPSITANWDAVRGQRWTIPVGIGITRTLVFDRQPMSLGVQYYNNVKRPDGTGANVLRFTWSLIFPTKPHAK